MTPTKQALLAEFDRKYTDALDVTSGAPGTKTLRDDIIAALDRVERETWEKAHAAIKPKPNSNAGPEDTDAMESYAEAVGYADVIKRAALDAGHDLTNSK